MKTPLRKDKTMKLTRDEKRDLLELAKKNPDADILFNRDERLGDKVKCSLNGLLSLNDSGIPYIASPEELLDYDIVDIEEIIERKLNTQKYTIKAMDIKPTREWLWSYILSENDVVEQTLKEFDISENEVNLEELRDLQHGLINYFAE